MPGDAPRIAVVVSLNIPDATAEVNALVRRFTRVALAELHEAGARIVLLDPSAPELPSTDAAYRAEGVIFLGGGDVDAALYGHTGPVPNEYGVDRRADEYSMDIITATIERDAPLLCICRGSQLLNVALGGDLIPDIHDQTLHRGRRGEPMFIDEEIDLEPGSRVHGILGRNRITVRTGHHQAVNRVAPSLRVTARALDGMVEGTEHESASWVVGVQWHPEDDSGNAVDRRLLFGEFVDVVRRSRVNA